MSVKAAVKQRHLGEVNVAPAVIDQLDGLMKNSGHLDSVLQNSKWRVCDCVPDFRRRACCLYSPGAN